MSKRIGILVVCMMVFSVVLPVCGADFNDGGSKSADLVWYNDLQFDKTTGTIVGNRINSSIDILEIPAEIEGVKVTAIGDSAFLECDYLQEVQFSASLQKIGKDAFGDCRYIFQLELPDSLTYIDDGAFSYCVGLDHVDSPIILFISEKGLFWGVSGYVRNLFCLTPYSRSGSLHFPE